MWLSVQVQLLPLGQARSSMSALADRPLAWMLSWTPSAAALPCLLLPLPLLAHHTSSKGFCSGGLQPSAVSAAVPAAARCAATPPGCMAAASVDCAAAQQRGRCGSDHSSKCSHGSRRPGGSALRIRCSASWGSALWSGSVPRTFQHPQRAASCAVAACTSSGHQAALCLALMRGPCRNTAARRCTAGSGANLNPAAPYPHPEFEVKD